jgi:hypothetical protein
MIEVNLPRVLPRAYYTAPVADFLTSSSETILGTLTTNSDFAVDQSQRDAWLQEIAILRKSLAGLNGTLFFEFTIPRMGRRVDVILVTAAVVVIIEFKIGAKDFFRGDLDQVWDYALDLKNFHKGSHHVRILPILVATGAQIGGPHALSVYKDGVHMPVACTHNELTSVIEQALVDIAGAEIDVEQWASSPYHPTPTIIEAAQALYTQHTVDAIARHDAGARNLRVTSARIEQLVDLAQVNSRKIICFVTGVPGAGKTLVGLNVATKRRDHTKATHAVFLSGNAALVAVLREALTRDEMARRRSMNELPRKGKVAESIKAFIQNVHHFRDESLRDLDPPVDHIVIFDEAQRAWNLDQTAKFMRTKKKLPDFSHSEPEFLISCLDRHKDWAAVVCLVGGGQEINTGEAGITAWLDALNCTFQDWDIYISPELTDSEYAAGHALDYLRSPSRVTFDRDLHLAVSMRSFRAENVSHFVKAVLDCDEPTARSSYAALSSRYPIALTRNLDHAKGWIRKHARGSERYGLVASSSAQRLKPHAIDVRVEVDPIHWFLNNRHDTRSSYYLEDAATEFQMQGLELDWVCVTWDGDLRFGEAEWNYHSFRGAAWCNIRKLERQTYLRNAYRVLLTRARQGMVIFIPPGDTDDPTRNPTFYDSTFSYLAGLGIPVLES